MSPSKLPWRCPVQEGYFYHVEEDFCFKLETSRTTWYAAVRACAATPGGFLAELNTEVKHQAVHEAVQSLEDYRSTDYYIGGSRFVAPDSWTWMNKMPVNQSNVVRTMSNTQRCLSMSSIDGRYSGLRCLKRLGRVCEKRPSIKDAKQCIDSLVPAKCDTKAIEGLCDSVKSDTKRTMKYKCKRTCGFCSKRNIQRGRCKDKLTYDTCDSIKKRNLCQNPAKRQRCMKTCGKCQDDTKCGANSSLMAGSIAATGALENSPCVYTINSSSRNQTKLFILTIFRFPAADTILVTPPRRFNVTYSLPNTNKTEMYSYTGNSFNLTLVSSTTSTGTRFLLTWEPAGSAEAGLEDDMLSVFCNSSAMSVKYKVSGAWRVSLADPSCSVGLVNNTYSITAEFNTCDTKRAENATRTSFSNKLLFILSHGRTFRRFSRILRCPFPRSQLVYESIGVLQNTQRPPTNTTIWMDIYKGSEKISVFPVIVDYSTAFTILFTTSHPTMASQLQPRDCFMALSREDRRRFPLITNSCPRGTVNVTWTRRGIHIFVASMQKLTSATEAHIFCTVERCKHAPCRLCYPHTPSKTKVVDLQQGPFIITLPAKSNSTGITQSAPHAAVSDSSVSSSRPGDSEVRFGVKDGKPVSTGDSTTDGYQHRSDVENRSAETEAREPPLSATSDPHWTPSHPSGDPYTSQTPSHPSGGSDTSRTPSHPSGGSDTSRTPSHPSGGSDTSRTPSHPSGGSDTSRTPSHPSGGSDTSRTPSHPSGGSDTSRTPSHPSGDSQVPMEIPIPGSESGVLEMPPQNETSHVSGTLSTGTAVGVGVGVVMVSVMAITLAMIKYGPGVKIFKRSNARNPQTKA
ncbi:uncharacterized protein LOC124150394 [Haliotis rufescens]|uniref:uncharacterized protein LOC124150394 n=1 Tax=Haliotis rufescens TaxID=6454 RepID=UPI00201E8018|nr:uncharacterized protein LOC124150394 [Haliotis rufescens]